MYGDERQMALAGALQRMHEQALHETTRPCVLFRPTLTRTNGRWEARYGAAVGTGDTPDTAMLAFDLVWYGS